MKRYLPLGLLLLAFTYMSTTGFQCGSAETTSAKLYMNQKQWDKAEASLVKELAKNDKNEEAWFLLGQVRLELKKYAEMNEAYTHALQLGETHKVDIARNRLAVWAMMYNDGVNVYNKGRDTAAYFKTAIDRFTIAINMVPDSSGTYYVRALAYYATQDLKSALKDLEKAVALNPGMEDASRLAGQIHYNLGGERENAKDTVGAVAEFKAAVLMFEKAYNANPNSSDNIINLIDVYQRTKDAEKAFGLTQSAVQKDPNNKIFRYAFGTFLLKQDKFTEAIEQFKKAVEIDPTYADAVYNLGVSYLNWGVTLKEVADKKYEAERAKNKSKDIKEDFSYKEKFKDALPWLEKAQEMRPDDLGLLQSLGKVYANLNMVEKSKTAFERFDRLSKGK
jgi:tetratricopeptide (TPR) repeat protein